VNFAALVALVEKPRRQIGVKQELICSLAFANEFREVAVKASR